MKSNSLKEKFNNYNFNSPLKVCLIVSLVIILLGIIIVSIFNFNLSVEYTGGKVVNIETKEVLNEKNNYKTLTSQINTIISNEGFCVKSIQQQAEGEYSTLVVKFTTTSKVKNESEALSDIQTKLSTELEINGEKQTFTVSTPQTFDGKSNATDIIYAVCAIVLTITLVLIYLGIRFKLLSGLTTLIILCHDVLLTLSLTGLFRIEITSGYIYSIFATIIFSLIASILLFDKLRENKLKEVYAGESNEVLANATIKGSFKKILLIMLAFLMIGLVLLIISTNSIRHVVLPLILGTLVVLYSSTMLTLPIWARMANKFPKK